MIGPVAATFVGRTGHIDEGGLEAFNSAGGFMVLCSCGAEVDATGVHDGMADAAGEVRSRVRNDTARCSMAADDVFGEDVKDLF